MMRETIDELEEALEDGIEAVLDLMRAETDLDEDEFEELLKEIKDKSNNGCVKGTVTKIMKVKLKNLIFTK